MSKIAIHIAAVSAVMLLLLSSCGKDDEAQVIPRGKLSEIYAEMLVTDQWITSTPGMRMIADTSLVYAPILEKYGYDLEDYLKSMDVYMGDPERFSRILRKSGEMIERKLKDAEMRLSELQRKAMLPKIEADFKPEEFFPYLFDEPYVHYYDSLAVKTDSLLQIYRIVNVERADTVFDGVRIIVKSDTSDVADTLAAELPAADTVSVPEVVDRVERELLKERQPKRINKNLKQIDQWGSEE